MVISRRLLSALCLISGALSMMAGCRSDSTGQMFESRVFPVINGTLEPEAIPLTPEEQNAVVWIHSLDQTEVALCTGILITDILVATAKHCVVNAAGVQLGVGFGPDLRSPLATIGVESTHEHPRLDLSLLVLDLNPSAAMVSVRPISINESPHLEDWLGMTLQSAGYGDTEGGRAENRHYVSLPLVSVDVDEFLVDGENERGLCFGDSGAPLIGDVPGQGRVVLGIESWGSPTCRGVEHVLRLDRARAWIRSIERESTMPPSPCNSGLDSLCWGTSFLQCRGDEIHAVDCADESLECRWDATSGQRGCAPALLCEGLGEEGTCLSSESVVRCPLGVAQTEECPVNTVCEEESGRPVCERTSSETMAVTDAGIEPVDDGGTMTPVDAVFTHDGSFGDGGEETAKESTRSSGCHQFDGVRSVPMLFLWLGIGWLCRRV